MFSFVMVLLILLPPTSVGGKAHPTRFTIRSNVGYLGKEACQSAMARIYGYTALRLPKADVVLERDDCIQSVDS